MPTSSSENLGQKVVSGAAWSGVSRAGQQLVQAVSLLVLARMLGPAVYGLMAMANVVTNFLQQIGDMGTGSAAIQRESVNQEFLSSLFWFNLAVNTLVGLLVVVLAPLAGSFYREPRIVPVLSTLAVTFPIMGVGVISQALLIRTMEYRKLAIVEVLSAAAGTTVGIVMALFGLGVWSLVGASVASTTATTVLSLALARWKPSFTLDLVHLRSIYSYSANLMGFVFVNYFSRNSGHILVGRYLGSEALGYYNMAYALLMFPIQNVTGILGRVLFSAFARLQDDHKRLGDACLRALAVISAITFPMMIGAMVVAEPLVRAVLGEKWLPALPLFLVLAPLGMLQSVGSPVGQIYLASGRTDVMLRMGIINSVVQIAGYAAGLPWGLQGVVTGYAISNLLLIYPGIGVPFHLIGLRLGDFFRCIAPAFGVAATMGAATYGWRIGLAHWLHPGAWATLSATVLFGVAVYAILLRVVKPAFLADLMRPLASREWTARLASWLSGAPIPGPGGQTAPHSSLK